MGACFGPDHELLIVTELLKEDLYSLLVKKPKSVILIHRFHFFKLIFLQI